ncbi:4-galactosyl-N-acetylglucosaminide 3-alpha-L-fucosyltransferase 9-like [Platichthys flesus]|uniref:4-galactosyl-N-acetylglucosaminide 3-alpha-L-fucosyltransferase 9-like n=1 Tax=Platichthys flesus TaxID=8260 RepID=UPI002DB8FAFA|nr:4-galactosyl-N-acetylglucosaminide 3-alpha-L-fucosyltransferase 9-like [Platichthys flesus]XP_062265163.1 4-galactosyl-N-acetylglucosaminide 3-alpha-L-fucosyltransferase 9-like [Platichthys flesus]XP_062265164.1 4-galactosyl-N-acetylglucosaminide 3-alpha-L-fucosyltransferase 9-like [Platichthys flesus]
MAPISMTSFLRNLPKVTIVLAGVTVLFLMYFRSFPSPRCHPSPKWATGHTNKSLVETSPSTIAATKKPNKPIVLLWFWPDDKQFDFQLCKDLNINSCQLTDDRSLYSVAKAVVIFHKAIKDDLSNLPTTPRPKFQRWIWFNMDPPTNTRKIPGIESVFNLTLNYRRDADISARWQLTSKKQIDKEYELPEKDLLVCWIANASYLNTSTEASYSYYRELAKHIKVNIFDSFSAKNLKGENYFLTISKCKFFLSFEDSVHPDYITETFNGPLSAGTVPIALGPPRKNYETYFPSTSFIHINDFPDAFALAEYLLKMDEDNAAYMEYFQWRRFYNVRRHFNEENQEFAHAVCQACRHIALTKEFRVVRDLYKWYLI